MKISELTKQLNQIQLGHGDLICEVRDGMDPSDPAPVRKVKIGKEQDWQHGIVPGPVVYIEA